MVVGIVAATEVVGPGLEALTEQEVPAQLPFVAVLLAWIPFTAGLALVFRARVTDLGWVLAGVLGTFLVQQAVTRAVGDVTGTLVAGAVLGAYATWVSSRGHRPPRLVIALGGVLRPDRGGPRPAWCHRADRGSAHHGGREPGRLPSAGAHRGTGHRHRLPRCQLAVDSSLTRPELPPGGSRGVDLWRDRALALLLEVKRTSYAVPPAGPGVSRYRPLHPRAQTRVSRWAEGQDRPICCAAPVRLRHWGGRAGDRRWQRLRGQQPAPPADL